MEDVDIRIEGEEITEVGRELKADGEVMNCSRMIAMPGMVNAHTHLGMSLLRGYRDDEELMDWLNSMWSVERRLSEEVIGLSSELSIIESIMSGTTAFIDMYFHPSVTMEVAKKYGIRGLLGPVFIDGLNDPKLVENDLRNMLSSRNELIKPVINIHGIYSVGKDTLERAAALMDETGLPLNMHVDETRDEVMEIRRKYGKQPIEVLMDVGLVRRNSIFVHLGWVSSWELEIITREGANVVHCPTSNMKLATGGFFPIVELMKMGVNVGIGTDGPASNNSLDVFREMKMAVLLQRNNYWSTAMKASHAISMATKNGYELIGVRGGDIAPGNKADLVLLSADSIGLLPMGPDNLVSNLVYSATGRDVVATIVNGRIIYGPHNRDEFIERAIEIGRKLEDYKSRLLPMVQLSK
ncbi:N-ethylammeline chlorohydrolase [Thermocladium modestius]|uniref:N-ethylammeline chlorohydrolase n=2 Tax=Thermocladium modestius TaxID=62609 RepID=A0A830GZY8_9CREN|nr:N-ethylammeline chlorohydrolase [Thermocladium modestius]